MTAVFLWDGAHHWWGGGFLFLIFALILVLLFLKLWFFRGWWGRPGWRHDFSPEERLKWRLAGGEITEAEYEHLLALIRR